MNLLDTSSAVYEKNGDYAAGIFSSNWCRFLDESSFKLCNTNNAQLALTCDKWHCHKSCWADVSKTAIEKNKIIDMECNGGLHIYCVPICIDNEIIGAINFGYGDPPKDHETLNKIANKYNIDIKTLEKFSNEYETRPKFIIDYAKFKIKNAASYISLMVQKKTR